VRDHSRTFLYPPDPPGIGLLATPFISSSACKFKLNPTILELIFKKNRW